MLEDLIEFDGKNMQVRLRGTCDELRHLCQAMCCRHSWSVQISKEEFETGIYDALQTCSITGSDCFNPSVECLYSFYQLKKKPDKSCVYLDEDSYCSIYEDRPHVCRAAYPCNKPWKLVPGSKKREPISQENYSEREIKHKEDLYSYLDQDIIFVQHPLQHLKMIALNQKNDKIIFVKELISNCGSFFSDGTFDSRGLNDQHLMSIYEYFSAKKPTSEILQDFQNKFGEIIDQETFYEVVWLFYQHNLLVSSKILEGLLHRRTPS